MNRGHNLVLESTQEQDRYLDVRNQAVGSPDLVAQISEILCRRDDAGYQLPHAEECILQDQATDIATVLVLGHELHTDSTAKALSIYDNFVVPRLGAIPKIVESRLSVDVKTRLVRLAGRNAIAAVLKHKDVAAHGVDEHAGNGQAVANVTCVAMEHEYRHVRIAPATGAANVKGREFLSIVGRDDEFLVISDVELVGTWEVGPRVRGHMRGIDKRLLLEVEK